MLELQIKSEVQQAHFHIPFILKKKKKKKTKNEQQKHKVKENFLIFEIQILSFLF